jgi:DNA-binding transcriptional MocR family regulator
VTGADLASGGLPWPPELRELWDICAARAAAQAGFDRSVGGGDRALREQVAERHGRHPDTVTIAASARQVAYALAGERGLAVVERPTYGGITKAMRHAGAGVVPSAWEDMEDAAAGPPGLAWLTSPLRNPDGRSLAPGDCARVERLAARGWLVVQNATYAPFQPGWSAAPGAALAGTFNKLLGRGFGLAWLCSDTPSPGLARLLAAGRPPAAWQRAMALFMAEGGWDRMQAHVVVRVLAARDAFRAALGAPAARDWNPFVLQELPGPAERDALLADLRERGIRAKPDTVFELERPAVRYSFFGAAPDLAAACGSAVRECLERRDVPCPTC